MAHLKNRFHRWRSTFFTQRTAVTLTVTAALLKVLHEALQLLFLTQWIS